MEEKASEIETYIDYLNESKSPWHCIDQSVRMLESQGFVRIRESDPKWEIKPAEKYFFTRDGSSLFAFIAPGLDLLELPALSVLAAHTDSPTLRVKPKTKQVDSKFLSIAIEPYGGGIWETFFDRTLCLAGRVTFQQDGRIKSKLIRIDNGFYIPNLAIHHRHSRSSPEKLDLSKNIVVIASVPGLSKKDDKKEKDKKKKSDLPHDEQIMEVICHAAECLPTELLDFDLEFSDGQPCCTVGIDHSMLSGGRQDNLLGCYGCVRALLDSSSQISRDIRMITLFDHEEIGSRSRVGGWTPTLYRTVSRIVNSLYSDIMTTPPDIDCIIARGMALSVDQAHSVHPGYSDR
ncbi:Peptidase M18 like protein, partial [Aduncisulcus paluster]